MASDIDYRLTSPTAARALHDTASDIAQRFPPRDFPEPLTLTDPDFTAAIVAGAHALPPEIGSLVEPPRTEEGFAVIGGIQLSDKPFGSTPKDWRHAARYAGDDGGCATSSYTADVAMLLLAARVGQPFGWQGQQAGRLVNNIVPTRGHEAEQSGASSSTPLSAHTEDAFHPQRANLLLLGCIRNPDRVGTTVASVRQTRLNTAQRRVLHTRTLPILPDVSYGTDFTAAPPVPTLWTNPHATDSVANCTIRYDPAYTPLTSATSEFQDAYRHLTHELTRVARSIILAPGQLLLLDNDIAVHGRARFTARYDGHDRWLKRVNIALPRRPRNPSENSENGYAQQIINPFAAYSNGDRHERSTET